jgi:membrane fusion protein, multidrug efflux system
VVTRRNVNPGNNVQVGQSLMALRSLREIWVDANFKETQLRDLRIGQPVDLYVDMYGARHVFKGRISGFTMGTGSTLALLPPENATGNFVMWCSGCRSVSTSKDTTRTRIRCSTARPSFLTST